MIPLQLLFCLILGLSALEENLDHSSNTCSRGQGSAEICPPIAEISDKSLSDVPGPSSEMLTDEKMEVPVMEEIQMEEIKMEEPMTLVENVDGALRLNPDALNVLRSIERPVVVVAVVGAARTGKSYLLNRLAGSKKGFPLGSTVQSLTKGIWMWSLPHPQRADQSLILLDSEGLGDPEKGDEQNDNSVFALAILLSSVFVYNSQGTINQHAMSDLHFVTELAKRIQVKSQPDGSEAQNFVQFFPDFVWTLRDFTLDLNINGSVVTADQYLENSLRLRKEETKQDQSYNTLRRCIREYFPSRRCFGLVSPAPRKVLRQLQGLSDDQLDQEFVRDFRSFSEYIYTSGKVKKVLGGHQVTGKRLSQLAESYVEAIARGELPCVENGIARMAGSENEAAVQKALEYYDRKLVKLLPLPGHIVYQLTDLFTYYHNEAVRIFMKYSLMDKEAKHIRKLEELLQSRYESELSRIEVQSGVHCEEALSTAMASIRDNLDSGYYLRPGGYRDLEIHLEEGISKYNMGTVEEVKGAEVLEEFLTKMKPRLAEVQKVNSVLHDREEDVFDLKEELAKLREERWAQEQGRQEAKRAGEQDLLRQLKGKFEEERERAVAEQTEVIGHKLREGGRYRAEGAEEDSGRSDDERRRYERARDRTRDQTFWDYIYAVVGWLGRSLGLI
ncbi:guanylate-binding protein 1-like isoform X1 [Carcharodon carcharias]|uniref:guanylate-binding protein 1-like isoform X1 n=1 Tax=Carcharodon carcharias TaxID=13397 RepID=UPI001B7E3654|nr:guanylate-binding protein 1-like isoform X1 [Carcharodon carcharias]